MCKIVTFAKKVLDMEEKYKITDENLMILSLEVIKFYHESMKERLKDLIQTSRDTTERSYKLISIYPLAELKF